MSTDAGRGSSFRRFLSGAILAVIGVMLGMAFSVFLGGRGMVDKTQAKGGEPGDGATKTEGQPAAAVEHACVVALVNHAHDAVRSDLVGAAVLDVAARKELVAELDNDRSIRFPCPTAATALDFAVRTKDGAVFAYRDIAVDPALAYFELEAEAGGESGPDDFLARRSEAGIEAPPPEWLTAEAGDAGDAGEEGGSAGEEAEPAEPAEPQPMKGDIYVEVRDLVGETRAKGDIRELAKRRGAEIEACVQQHAPKQPRVAHNVQLAIGANGETTSSLLVQGTNIPELDACVEGVMVGWNYGAAEQPSFFKLKAVWSAP